MQLGPVPKKLDNSRDKFELSHKIVIPGIDVVFENIKLIHEY